MSRKQAVKNLPHAGDAVDSDDEAPEVVSKASAQQQVEALQRQETAARKSAAASNKRKRVIRATTKDTPPVAVGAVADTDVTELPADVLSAVAARHEEDDAAQQIEAANAKAAAKRLRVATKPKTHTRTFGSVVVQTPAALAQQQPRALSADAQAFAALRSAPQRTRAHALSGHASLFTKKQKQLAARTAAAL